MSSTIAIPRRPSRPPSTPSRTVSLDSISSVYSESPGFVRSLSNSSRESKDSLSGVDSEAGSAPPIPPKAPRQQLPQTPKNVLGSPISKFQASPPRGPEIWRRRSVKSDRSLSISDLKLVESNGSTTQQPLPQHSLPPAPSQLPRVIPGRKPVPLRPAPPQPDLMGSKLSKLKNKVQRASEGSRSDETTTLERLPIQRLGPPDHLKLDKQQPLTPHVLTALSQGQLAAENPPEIPPKSESRRENVSTHVSVTNRTNILSINSQEPKDVLTIASNPAVMRSPQPRQGFTAPILTPRPSPLSASEQASPPDFRSTRLPHLPSPAPEGTIFLGPELNVVHFECYQSHRIMRSSTNTVCPVACMVCKRKDMENRWRCTWCCLSACGSCMKILSSIPGKDLGACLKEIER
jgi:hypothetical protein